MANWIKPGLALLKDALKGLEDNVLKRAVEGDKNALTAIAKEHGSLAPTSDRDQQALVNQVINPEMSRRQLFRRLGGAAAHAALEMPSPLRFLQSTLEQVKPSLELNLSPLEMLKYSQKYMDRKLPDDLSAAIYPDHEENGTLTLRQYLADRDDMSVYPRYQELGLSLPLGKVEPSGWFLNDPQYTEASKNLVQKRHQQLLSALELKPTPQNIKSLEELGDTSQIFHPDGIDAQWDDIKYQAQDFAAGEYQTADQFLEEKAKEYGTTPEELEKELEGFLSKVHAPSQYEIDNEILPDRPPNPSEEYGDTHINARRNLDSHVENEAYNRGYMDEVSSNDSLANYFDDEFGPGKSAKDFLEWWDQITPESEVSHVLGDEHPLYSITSYDLGHDVTEEQVNQLRKDFEDRLNAYHKGEMEYGKPVPSIEKQREPIQPRSLVDQRRDLDDHIEDEANNNWEVGEAAGIDPSKRNQLITRLKKTFSSTTDDDLQFKIDSYIRKFDVLSKHIGDKLANDILAYYNGDFFIKNKNNTFTLDKQAKDQALQSIKQRIDALK